MSEKDDFGGQTSKVCSTLVLYLLSVAYKISFVLKSVFSFEI
jgi:hypothetical protein